MTIQLTPEDEKLIQERLRTGAFHSAQEVIHRALMALPPEAGPNSVGASPVEAPRKNLVDVLSSPPFVGSELNLERQKDYRR